MNKRLGILAHAFGIVVNMDIKHCCRPWGIVTFEIHTHTKFPRFLIGTHRQQAAPHFPAQPKTCVNVLESNLNAIRGAYICQLTDIIYIPPQGTIHFDRFSTKKMKNILRLSEMKYEPIYSGNEKYDAKEGTKFPEQIPQMIGLI